MKLILLIMVLVLNIPFLACADDFSFTGFTAQDIDHVWFSGGGGFDNSGSFLGGPGAEDNFGLAQQFSVDQEILLNQLHVAATSTPFGEGTTLVTFSIYTHSSDLLEGNPVQPRPDIQSLAYTSSPLAFSSSSQEVTLGQDSSVTTDVPFSYDLKPGTYWISEAGNGPTIVRFDALSYKDHVISNTAQTPEPPLVWLFLLMGTFIAFKTGRLENV